VNLEVFGLADDPRLGPQIHHRTSQPHPDLIVALLNLPHRGLGMIFGLGYNSRPEPLIHPRTPQPRPDLIVGPLNLALGWCGVDYILVSFVHVDMQQIDLPSALVI
jgi:hypothetical protein